MTQEEKRILLVDLCARLPYGVQGITSEGVMSPLLTKGEADWDILTSLNYRIVKHGWKPYLRPMFSMTEEEKVGYNRAADMDLDRMTNKVGRKLQGDEKLDETLTPYYEHIDWLNAHHFDYRGLIPMGLGIDCTGLNIYENEESI